MQTDYVGCCEKKVNTGRSQALLGTTNLFRKLRREESAAKKNKTKSHNVTNIHASIIAVPRERLCHLFAIFYRNCTAVL